jgi:hypothetical protein
LEAVFSVRSVSKPCSEDQLPLRESLETAVRRVGVWCEMAASLREHEPRAEERPLLEGVTKQRSEDRNFL